MTEHTDDNLDRIDKALQNLGPEDAPDQLVQSTLERVRATPIPEPAHHRSRSWANGLAAAVVAVAAVGIILYQELPTYREPESPLITDDGVLVSSRTDEELVQFAFKRVDELRAAGAVRRQYPRRSALLMAPVTGNRTGKNRHNGMPRATSIPRR